MSQPQGVRGHDCDRRGVFALTGEDVEDDVGGVDALAQSLGAGGFDGPEPVAEDGGEDAHHLPIAIVGAGQLENTARMRAVRRDVARIQTVLNQKAAEAAAN